ncbi:proton-coupled folate transporter-like [Manduca sexta]|uniref:proton-coupled folate transporter-like n=1 Tax=Manduca sexta TaxID=7130 RepID=UPI00188ECCB3|nr:proton-coupled folate transporter-like [Manduca sexta]
MNDNKENGEELTNTEKNSDTANVKSEVKEEPPVSWSERIKKLANWFTVEPCLILYFLALTVGNIAIEQLNQEKACRSYLNYNETICTDIIKNLKNDNRTNELRTEIIIAVNDIKAWQYPMQKGIPGILVPFIGAWSDRTGNRKVLIMMPVIGEIISNCGLFFTTYYFVEWPLWLTALIESLPTALSGGFSILLLGVFSYIADVTTAEARTFRMGMLAIIVPLCSIFGQSINGILLNAVGYYGVFTIILALHSFALIYIYIRIYDIRNEATEGTFIAKLISFFNPYNIWDTISLVIVIPLQQRIRVILLLCAFVFITGPIEAKGLLVYGYQTHRYLMSAVEISMFNTYATLLGIAGTTVAITVFSKYLKMHDSFLGIIGTGCKIVSCVVYGLAPTKQWFFAGPAFDIFGNVGVTAVKSIGTKVVDPDKVGKMLSLFGLTESLQTLAFVPLFSRIYTNTINTLPGAIFFLASILTLPAFIIFGILYYVQKKQKRDVVENPAEKRKHAYDNDVTAL